MKTTTRSSFFILVFLILVVEFLLSSSAAFSLWNQTDFNNCVKLTETAGGVTYDYRLYWSLVGESIEIGLAAQTPGWMGLGLSTDGSMDSGGAGSDVWVGWFGDTPDVCAGAHGCVIDYWATGLSQPDIDSKGNLFSPSFGTLDGYKWLKFTRALDTNDTANDRVITPNQPQFVIHALGPSIPTDSLSTFSQHIDGTNQASYIQFGQARWECNETSPTPPTTQLNYYSNPDQTWHVYWSLVDDGQSVEFNVSAFTTSSWWALGINTVESMVGADILWCSVDSGVGVVVDRRASGHSTPGQDASQDVTLVSYQSVDGWSTCQIRRKLNTGDTQGDLVITDSSMIMLWAFGPTSSSKRACDQPGFCQHAANTKGLANVNFVSGGSSNVATTDDKRKAHGILMLFTWGLVAVAGAFIARYCKTPQGKWVLYGYIWVHIHGFLGVTTFVINLIAFALIVDFVRDADGSHFRGAHQVIGLIMFICTFVQPLIGVIAELFLKKYKDPNWVAWVIGTTHAWFGRALVLLGLVEVYLGLALYCVPTYAMVTYGVSVACMIALFLVHEPLRWFAPWGSWLGGPGFTYQRAEDGSSGGDAGTELKDFSPENKIPWMNMRPQRHPPLVVKICLWTLQVGLAAAIIGLWIAAAVGVGKKDITDPNDSYDSTCQIGDKFE